MTRALRQVVVFTAMAALLAACAAPMRGTARRTPPRSLAPGMISPPDPGQGSHPALRLHAGDADWLSGPVDANGLILLLYAFYLPVAAIAYVLDWLGVVELD